MAKMPDSVQLLDNRFTVLLRGHTTDEETVKQLLTRIRGVEGVVEARTRVRVVGTIITVRVRDGYAFGPVKGSVARTVLGFSQNHGVVYWADDGSAHHCEKQMNELNGQYICVVCGVVTPKPS